MAAGVCFQCNGSAGWELVAVLQSEDDGQHAAVFLRSPERDGAPLCAGCAEEQLARVLVEPTASGWRREDGCIGYASRRARWVFHPDAFSALVARINAPPSLRLELRAQASDIAELRSNADLTISRRAVLAGRVSARGLEGLRRQAGV